MGREGKRDGKRDKDKNWQKMLTLEESDEGNMESLTAFLEA